MTARRAGAAPAPRRGEVWWVALDPTVGSEIQKTRPCLVVGTDALAGLPVRIVVPLTKWQQKHAQRPWCVRIDPDAQNHLGTVAAADAVQVRCVSVRRFRNRLGSIGSTNLFDILGALALCLDLSLPENS